jgi:AraC-like DNA-binding protein/tetratricopeptide (TPR) repeat protein
MNLAFTTNDEFIRKLFEIIHQNLENEKFDVVELTRESGLNRSQLHRRIKAITGQNISQFIRGVRLEKAMEMLQQNWSTASEVSYKVGFSSPTYFSKCFREQFGYPPGEVRKREPEFSGEQENGSDASSGQVSLPVEEKTIPGQSYLFNIRNIFYASIGVIAVLILVYSLFPRFGMRNNDDQSGPDIPLKSIAVLPVTNLTGDSANDYIAAGIHTSLTDELYRLGNLLVRPAYSTLKFTGSQKPVSEIAKEMKVDIYLKPTLLCYGDSLCVSVQLFQAEPEEKLLWSNSFVQNRSNVFSIFKNSALNIAEKINLRLTSRQKTYLSSAQSVNPDFFNAMMLGRHFLSKSNPGDFEKGVRELKKAIDINPLDPAPYLALAVGYGNAGHASAAGPDATKMARAYAQKVLQLDSTQADAHAILATWYLYQDWDFAKAEYHLKKAIELNPNIPSARYTQSWYLIMTGKNDEAIKEMKMAVEIDPLDPICIGYLGWAYMAIGKYEEAIRAADRTLEVDPNFTMGFFVKGWSLAELGKYDQAVEVHQKGIAIRPGFLCGLGRAYALAGQRDKALEIALRMKKNPNGWNAWGLSEIYAGLKDKENTLKWIESMITQRMDFVPWIESDRSYNFLHNDRKYRAIIKSLNLPS